MRSLRNAIIFLALAACSAPEDHDLYWSPILAEDLLADFEFSDPAAWRAGSDGAGPWLELFGASEYLPPFRSPLNIALMSGLQFGDFVLEAEVQQTGREYGHRDLCLFFGYQGPSQFYYVHFASAADENAHNVFLVDDAPRRNIATQTTAGIEWGDGVWHRVRLERRLGDGSIRVYFDDMSEPIMVAWDRRFGMGMLGFGSFDDVGRIRNMVLRGGESRPREGAAFGGGGGK